MPINPKECEPINPDLLQTARLLAKQGESLRLVGNYSKAITWFTMAINKAKEAKTTYRWAYAHRAVAHGALGDFCSALGDFKIAEEYYYNPVRGNKAWFLAQKGDFFRLIAAAAMKTPIQLNVGPTKCCEELLKEEGLSSQPRWMSLISKSIDLLNEAENESKRIEGKAYLPYHCTEKDESSISWIRAHRGAAYTMRYATVSSHIVKNVDAYRILNDFINAEDDFAAALRSNPSYGWVYAFRSVLWTMGPNFDLDKRDSAKDEKDKYDDDETGNRSTLALYYAGKALMHGLSRQPSMVRAMMTLFASLGGKYVKENKKEKAIATYKEGLNFAWQSLQSDVDETFARYYVANILKQLRKLDVEGITDKMVDAAILRARVEVDGIMSLSLALSGGLDCLEGKKDDAKEKYAKLEEKEALYALTNVKLDPAWQEVLEKQKPKP